MNQKSTDSTDDLPDITIIIPSSGADNTGTDDQMVNPESVPVCPLIDPKKTFSDGIPYAPDQVLKSNDAFVILNCAMNQTLQKLWTPPTKDQINTMNNLLTAFYANYKEQSTKHSADIMSFADKLGLQVCRVQKKNTNKPNDSFLIFLTKYGVKNYNGPFMLLRETGPFGNPSGTSNVIIVSPHDSSDYTHSDTKIGFATSNAFACVSNGHRKWSERAVDFCHTQNTLGFSAMTQLTNILKKDSRNAVLLHVHGMSDPTCVMRSCIVNDPDANKTKDDSLKADYLATFDNTIKANSSINQFRALGVYFVLKDLHVPFYLQTEIPVILHKKNPMIVSELVNAIEQRPWAWTNKQ
jgi:hypothetical protein